MSDERRKRMDTDPELRGVPRELRPFARELANPVIRPGDDPELDAAVARLRELNGTGTSGDPLFYPVPRPGEGEGERGIGNVRVYFAPVALPGVEAEAGKKEERRRRGMIVGIAVGVIGLVGMAMLTGRAGPMQSDERLPERARSAEAGTATGADAGAVAATGADAGAVAATGADAGAGTATGASAAAEPVAAAGGAAGAAPHARDTTSPSPWIQRPATRRTAVPAPRAPLRDKAPPRDVAPPAPTPPPDPFEKPNY